MVEELFFEHTPLACASRPFEVLQPKYVSPKHPQEVQLLQHVSNVQEQETTRNIPILLIQCCTCNIQSQLVMCLAQPALPLPQGCRTVAVKMDRVAAHANCFKCLKAYLSLGSGFYVEKNNLLEFHRRLLVYEES